MRRQMGPAGVRHFFAERRDGPLGPSVECTRRRVSPQGALVSLPKIASTYRTFSKNCAARISFAATRLLP